MVHKSTQNTFFKWVDKEKGCLTGPMINLHKPVHSYDTDLCSPVSMPLSLRIVIGLICQKLLGSPPLSHKLLFLVIKKHPHLHLGHILEVCPTPPVNKSYISQKWFRSLPLNYMNVSLFIMIIHIKRPDK